MNLGKNNIYNRTPLRVKFMNLFTIYLLIGCGWMFLLQLINDKFVIEEYRLELGVVEILIGMFIWPISFLMFVKSLFKREQ